MPGEQDGAASVNLNPLRTLLQGFPGRPKETNRKRNPLYPSTVVPQSKSKSNPASPVASKVTTRRCGTASSRRGPVSKPSSSLKYKPLPGFESELTSKACQQLGFTLIDFNKVDNLIFRSRSAPCSPSRSAANLPQPSKYVAVPHFDLSALCLTSQPVSPQRVFCNVSAQCSTATSPISHQPRQPALRTLLQQQQEQAQDQQQQVPLTPSPRFPDTENEDIQCGQQQQLESTPSPLPHQHLQNQLNWRHQARIPLSTQPELAPMQLSPFHVGAQDQDGTCSPDFCMANPMDIEEHTATAEVAEHSPEDIGALSFPRGAVAAVESADQPASRPPPCSSALIKQGTQHTARRQRAGADSRPGAATGTSGIAALILAGTSAQACPSGAAPAAISLDPTAALVGAAGQPAAAVAVVNSPTEVRTKEACENILQKEMVKGNEEQEPSQERRIIVQERAAWSGPFSAMRPQAQLCGDGQGCGQSPSRQLQPAQQLQQRGNISSIGPVPVEMRRSSPQPVEQHATLEEQQHKRVELEQLEGAGACSDWPTAPFKQLSTPCLCHQSSQRPHQEQPPSASNGCQPALQQQQQQPRVPTRQELAQRRAHEDQAVDITCPPDLRGVMRSFPTQKEAFAFADRCNSSQPLQRERAVLMSRLAGLEERSFEEVGRVTKQESRGNGSNCEHSGESVPAATVLLPEQALSHAMPLQQQEAAPHRAAPGQALAGPQVGRIDFLSRYAAGAFSTSGSQGYHSSYGQRQADGDAATLVEEAAAREQAKQAAREMYRKALSALRQPPPAPVATVFPPQEGAWHAMSSAALLPKGYACQAEHTPSVAALVAAGSTGTNTANASAPGAVATRVLSSRGGEMVPPAAEGQSAALHEEPIKVFCVERQGRHGVYYRQFVGASYSAVWREYRRTPMSHRHWYEVIREGRPCHLYFDLECPAACNPGLDMDGIINCLLHHVDEALGQHFGLTVEQSSVCELDSTTVAKHSRHLLVRVPGHAFINNHAMGQFVAQVVAAGGTELMVVLNEEDGMWERGSIVDSAVYSRNRHFRMVWSCKGGKAVVLVPSRRFATQEGCGKTAADVFLDALICRVDPSDVLLQMPNPIAARPASSGGCPVTPASGEPGPGGLRVAWKNDIYDGSITAEQRAELKQLAERAVSFIEHVACQRARGQPARARTLAFCGYMGTVAYSMIGPGSHYCENIGRFHQSNHIFFVVNFINGMFSQKCHDPACCHFRSVWMPLPPELCLRQFPDHSEPQGAGLLG